MSNFPRLVNVHIGKSAGTWLRTNIQKHYDPDEICEFRFEAHFDAAGMASARQRKFISAHIGHERAVALGGERITMLRNPFDRIMSLYSYWQEVEGAPRVARGVGIEEFLDYSFTATAQDLENAQTWQLAFGHSVQHRTRHAATPKDELLARAIANLDSYAVVGIYEDLPQFCTQLNARFGFKLQPGAQPVNTTRKRLPMDEVPIAVRNKIYARNDLDVALYDHVLRRVRRAARA